MKPNCWVMVVDRSEISGGYWSVGWYDGECVWSVFAVNSSGEEMHHEYDYLIMDDDEVTIF